MIWQRRLAPCTPIPLPGRHWKFRVVQASTKMSALRASSMQIRKFMTSAIRRDDAGGVPGAVSVKFY